jgi:hypothetical protein
MIQNKPRESIWTITTDRYVGFIDIMGFKDMVMRSSHDDIYRMMKIINKAKTLNENLHSTEDHELIRSTTYSDSIILYTKDNTDESLGALIEVISGVTNDLFIEGIPHKGSIAYGKMTLDTERSIFFGQPLIDAYLLQEELYFYGIIVHGSAEEKLEKRLIQYPFITKYICPLKKGKSIHFTVYPMHVDSKSAKSGDYYRHHQNIFNSLEKMKFKTSGYLRQYIDNTNNYFNYVLNEN